MHGRIQKDIRKLLLVVVTMLLVVDSVSWLLLVSFQMSGMMRLPLLKLARTRIIHFRMLAFRLLVNNRASSCLLVLMAIHGAQFNRFLCSKVWKMVL